MSSDGACEAGKDCQTGADCPSGFYCEEDSPVPKPCPLGTYMLPSSVGATDVSACQNCPEGRYCATSGLSSNIADLPVCDADGFHCEVAAQVEKPSLFVCPQGLGLFISRNNVSVDEMINGQKFLMPRSQ